MAYLQLRQPNLGVSGKVGFCLSMQADVWGTPHGVYEWAWYAWLGAQHKHLDQDFPEDVSVLVWFSYKGTQGHVVTHIPGKGFLSSPYQTGTPRAWLNSIAEIERIYGCKFVGWTEDINDVRVAEEEIAMGVKIVGAPASISWGDNRIDVFARGSDNALWHRYYINDKDQWRAWESWGDVIDSAPSVASWASGRLDVFATGTAGDLMHWWWDGERHGPETLGIPQN